MILYLVLFSYVTSQFWCKYAWDSICIDPVSAEIAGEPGNFQENSPDAFHGRGGISMVVAVAVFSSLATDPMGPWEPLLVLILVLNAGNGWVAGGCWDDSWSLLWIIPENSLLSTSKNLLVNKSCNEKSCVQTTFVYFWLEHMSIWSPLKKDWSCRRIRRFCKRRRTMLLLWALFATNHLRLASFFNRFSIYNLGGIATCWPDLGRFADGFGYRIHRGSQVARLTTLRLQALRIWIYCG